MKTYHSRLISHTSVLHVLHHRCHHPSLLLSSTASSKLIFYFFYLSTTGLTPRTPTCMSVLSMVLCARLIRPLARYSVHLKSQNIIIICRRNKNRRRTSFITFQNRKFSAAARMCLVREYCQAETDCCRLWAHIECETTRFHWCFYFWQIDTSTDVWCTSCISALSHLPYAICSSCTLCCMCSWQINDDDDDDADRDG